MYKFFLYFIFFFPFSCLGQFSISGKVVNSDNKPIPYASVFLNNTTIGTTTTNDGSFSLYVKPGKYDLVISTIGFESYYQTIIVNKGNVTLPTIDLLIKTSELNEVVIKDDPDREKYLTLFKNGFLGTSDIAKECSILNPELLDFDYNKLNGTLNASTSDFLEIVNPVLGYKLKYLLDSFTLMLRGDTIKKMRYKGSVIFEQMKGSKAQQERWAKKRQKVYLNSSMHFFRSVINGNIEDEGFRVMRMGTFINPERQNDSLINSRLINFSKKKNSAKWHDSLSYWKKQAELPKYYQKLIAFPNAEEILRPTDKPGLYALGCDFDGLYVSYNKSHHFDKNIKLNRLHDPYNNENTLISFNEPYAFIDQNGMPDDPYSLTFDGVWARQRAGELLPLDYDAPKEGATNNSSALSATETVVMDSIINKINYYGVKKSRDILYAHFDKTIYTNDENVWFTAYLLKKKNEIGEAKTLSVMLLNENNNTIALTEKFVMDKGVAFGNIFVPDTIPPGDYSFILYTDKLANGLPTSVFTQPVTIKTTNTQSFNVSASVIDSASIGSAAYRKILLRADIGTQRLQNAEISYIVGDVDHPLISDFIKTDKSGECILTIPAKYIVPGENIFRAEVKYRAEVKNISLTLPFVKNAISIKFYPEGGNMVNDVMSIVGWEAKSSMGTPLQLKAVLFKNNLPIDTIVSDKYGMGRFRLIPAQGSDYYLKLINANDSIYRLPVPINKGLVVNIVNALADDTLNCRIISNYPEKNFMLVHNYTQAFFAIPVEVNPDGRLVKIDLGDVPKGLAEVTILDSLKRPVAERIFFAHYDRQPLLTKSTDKHVYRPREKVTIKLKLSTDVDEAEVSIACVQSGRIELKKANDIESYLYLKSELGKLPLKENYIGFSKEDRLYLENVLLIKGWRRYKWQELMGTAAKDTVVKRDSLVFSGYVTQLGKPLTKPKMIGILKDSTLVSVTTDKTGAFVLNNDVVRNMQDKHLQLFVNDKHKKNYNLLVNDPYIKINALLAKNFRPEIINQVQYLQQNTQEQILKGFEHTINLKEVIIKAHKDPVFAVNANECGDYVCLYNILDCPNHRMDIFNRQPVTGERYFIFSAINNKLTTIIYNGCNNVKYENAVNLDGVYYAKEFYGSDYSEITPSEPEFLSTIFWKHLCNVNSSKETELSFYTSDITGPFKIIVQGVSSSNPIYASKSITVAKP
jgi:hypothetical protein